MLYSPVAMDFAMIPFFSTSFVNDAFIASYIRFKVILGNVIKVTCWSFIVGDTATSDVSFESNSNGMKRC